MAMGTDETVSRFLRVSAAYMLGAAYCANLRAAFARSAARDHDHVFEHALHYRELITREASALMHAQLQEEVEAFACAARTIPLQAFADRISS
jgi:hypothetical protein